MAVRVLPLIMPSKHLMMTPQRSDLLMKCPSDSPKGN